MDSGEKARESAAETQREERAEERHLETLRYLDGLYEVNRSELLRRYPLGYILFFATNEREIHLPEPGTLPLGIQLDWSPSGAQVSDDLVIFDFPSVRDLVRGNTVEGHRVVVPRDSRKDRPRPVLTYVSMAFYVEVLETQQGSALGVVGLRKATSETIAPP
jgi:hypothetical protein